MRGREIVLITGTRKGIGRFLVEHFVKKGALVEGCSRSPIEWDLENYNHHITDVTNESQIKTMLSFIKKRHGRLDIVINNAGIASMNPFLLMPINTATNILQVNLGGTFLICRESAKIMMKQRYGRIINVSSIAVPLQLEGESIYAASKSAVVTFTKIIARELAGYGITCNVVGPAPIDTDLIRKISQDKIENLVNRLAIKKRGNFEDVANVIDFFVKPESKSVTGQVIYLGGA